MFLNTYRIELVNGLPDGLEKVKSDAFNTSGVNSNIVLPNSLTIVENDAFKNSLITRLSIGSGEIKIGNNAFSNTLISGLLEIPVTVKSVGSNAFSNTRIEELKIKSDKPTYGSTPFGNTPTIKKLEMPITLSGSLVYGLTQLEELYLTKGTTGEGFEYNCGSSSASTPCDPRSRPWYTSREYGGATNLSIGSKPLKVTLDKGIKSIGQKMFYNSYRVVLSSTLSNNIKIGSNAFTNSGIIIN